MPRIYEKKIEDYDTIENIKTKIEATFNPGPRSSYYLTSFTASLQDDRTLSDYNIRKKSTLFLRWMPG